MGFLSPSQPSSPPPPPPPPIPPDPPIKPKDTKEADRVQARATRKRGLRAARVTGGAGLTDSATVTKKTLLGQ
jgi:hypothetical protein